jgi:FkbM family methyltransferase
MFEKIMNCQKCDEIDSDIINKLHQTHLPIILFGAGLLGKRTLEILSSIGISVEGFCDNYPRKWNTLHCNRPVYKLEEWRHRLDDFVVLISCSEYFSIHSQLVESGVSAANIFFCGLTDYYEDGFGDYEYLSLNRQKIEKLYYLLADEKSKDVLVSVLNFRITKSIKYLEGIFSTEQYFEPGIIELAENEVFLDLGAFDGDTIIEFHKRTHGKYKQIIAFEPDGANYKELIANIANINKNSKINCLNIGTWNKKGILKFTGEGTITSSISGDGEHQIQVDTVDGIVKDDPVTFIKMDVESAEKETIMGARVLLNRFKPKIAVSVYHKKEDIFNIPLLLNEIIPEYKLYLRHYSQGSPETVCYAVIPATPRLAHCGS